MQVSCALSASSEDCISQSINVSYLRIVTYLIFYLMKFRIFRLRGDITQNDIQAILKVLVSKEFGRIFGKELGET